MAPTVGNSDLQNMLNQAMSQLQSVGGSNSKLTEQGTKFINSIYTVAEGENKEEQVEASVNIVQGLLDFIGSFKNHQAEANKKVNDNSAKIQKNENEAEQKNLEINAKIDEFASNIFANSENISNAIKEIEALQNDDADIREMQEKILEQLDIIEEKKKDLKDPEKREEALEAIGTAAEMIDSFVELLGQSILAVQEKIETQNKVVETNVNEITNNISESATQIADGVTEIQKYIAKDTTEAGKATKITTEGGVNVATGNTEVATGEAINSNGFSALLSGGQGAKLILDGNQRISGGQTAIQGGIANLSKVMSGIGKMGTDISALTNQTNALGKIGDGVIGLVGSYEKSVSPYISALGSYDINALTSANMELQTQVKEWENGNLENTDDSNQAANGEQQDSPLKEKFKSAFIPSFGI